MRGGSRITHDEAYRVLGVRPPFSADQLKSAYRKAAKKYHPDFGGSASDFIKAKEAFDLLLPESGRPAPPPPPPPPNPKVAPPPYTTRTSDSTNARTVHDEVYPEDMEEFLRRMYREAEMFRGYGVNPRRTPFDWGFREQQNRYVEARERLQDLKRQLGVELEKRERALGIEDTTNVIERILEVLRKGR